MLMVNIIDNLQELGLSKRESICYNTLLELGSSKTGIIVKKTGIPSSKIYEVLDLLIKRGFVTHIIKNNVKHYQASDPKTLINYIDNKKKDIQDILPQLLLKQELSETQSVEIFEGQKAIFTLFSNAIDDAKPNEPYLIFSINEENKDDATNLFFKNLTIRRKEKKLDVQVLRNERFYLKEKHTKVKLRYTKFNLPQGITIFRDTVILLSWFDSPTAIKIQSKTMAVQLRIFFKELWSQSTT
jgi:sugar-specific transcriptional regulator TrmB